MGLTDCWVEEAASDTEEDPGIDGEGEAKSQSDVGQSRRVGCLRDGTVVVVGLVARITRGSIGDLGGAEGEEQEQECADELANDGDEVVANFVGQPAEASEAVFMVSALAVLHEGERKAPAWTVEIHVGLGCRDEVGRRDEVVVIRRYRCRGILLCDECTNGDLK